MLKYILVLTQKVYYLTVKENTTKRYNAFLEEKKPNNYFTF